MDTNNDGCVLINVRNPNNGDTYVATARPGRARASSTAGREAAVRACAAKLFGAEGFECKRYVDGTWIAWPRKCDSSYPDTEPAHGAGRRSERFLCDRDCNHCPLVIHPNTRLLSALLNQLHDRFGDEVYSMVQTACPNLTCCADCRIDDFCHIEGCEILKHNKCASGYPAAEPGHGAGRVTERGGE